MKRTIYLYKSGNLIRKDDSLALITKKEQVVYLPINQINTIICFCDVELNKRVLSLLNRHNIIILFFNFYGQYIGRFTPKKYADGKVILKQVNAYCGMKRIQIAKIMTKAEIKNLISVLKYYNKKERCFIKEIDCIELLLSKTDLSYEIEDILLIEAQAKKIYYSCFDRIILNKEFVFERRSMNPTLNEVNSMLSYGYALLYSDVLAKLDRSSLLPQIAFIHSLSKSTDALQYDIADMFKPVFIDRLVFRLINRKQIKLTDFSYNGDICYMNKEGIKIFVCEYEKLMEKSLLIGSKYYSYHNLLTREVYKLSNYIIEKDEEYIPFVMRW